MSIKILVLYYSRHGSTQALARQIARGVESIPDCEAVLRTVEDITPHGDPIEPIVTLTELRGV